MAHSDMLSWFSRSSSTAISSKTNYIDSFINPEDFYTAEIANRPGAHANEELKAHFMESDGNLLELMGCWQGFQGLSVRDPGMMLEY